MQRFTFFVVMDSNVVIISFLFTRVCSQVPTNFDGILYNLFISMATGVFAKSV